MPSLVGSEMCIRDRENINVNSVKAYTIDSKKFNLENENPKSAENQNATNISEITESFELEYEWNKGNILMSKSLIDLPKRSIIIFTIGFDKKIDITINLLLIKSGKVFFNQEKIDDLMKKAPSIEVKSNITIKEDEVTDNVKSLDKKEEIIKNKSDKGTEKKSDKEIKINSDKEIEHKSDKENKSSIGNKDQITENVSSEEFTDYLYLLYSFVFLFSLLLIGNFHKIY